MPKHKEKIERDADGKIILHGWIPVEYLDEGFPVIKKSKIKSHTVILLRERAAWLMSKQPVKVRVSVEILKESK